ncbi:Retrovirus-related Pol polyprotein from transposon TNT 1-94 [Golovinomyces cichoracearum]|uniref:Retrovirus-related Pol polyprotein from transposon TNT 1-94 n=1 Tax=Golovinomyces cichoracearum TaxID=62708 RepID=A0A420J2G0_9PEZI|nr:Retrovirus-related Pol polyprotein from transposon TNT 1-94 [Golovinomyces cichoracearum]
MSKRKTENTDTSNDKHLSYTKDRDQDLPKARGNRPIRAALVNPDLDEEVMAKQYHLAFSTATLKVKNDLKWTRETLPPAPIGWNQMIRHQFAAEFKRVAEKEYQTLEAKGTWVHVEEKELPNDAEIILVIWIFTYKFDSDDRLIKFKARIYARGDLQVSKEDAYAATLASQSSRAMMARTAANDLEIRQFDVVNAFVNAPIRKKVFCHTPRGFEKSINGVKSVLRLQRALYGLKFSPLY